jgi:hypothetical protein
VPEVVLPPMSLVPLWAAMRPLRFVPVCGTCEAVARVLGGAFVSALSISVEILLWVPGANWLLWVSAALDVIDLG